MELLTTGWSSLLLFSVVTALLIHHLIGFLKKLWLLPPGPWGLPIVGYLPWINRESYLTFARLGKRYGGLYSVQFGGDTAVVLNDWPTIKATLVDHPKIFSGRPNMFMAKAAIENKNISFVNGPVWLKKRRLTAQCLRNIGLGKKSSESIVTEIVHHLLDKLTKMDGQVVSMETMFFGPIMRVNWEMMSSDSATGSGVTVGLLEKSVTEVLDGLALNNLTGVFPWLRFLSPNGFGFNDFKRSNDRLKSLFRKIIDEHIEKWEEGSEVDFLDHYITAKMNNHNPEEPPYDIDHLIGVMWDMFIAGSDTTNVTCQWGIQYIACNPEVQRKAQDELDRVVGRHRLLNVNDFPNLPYLDALLKEVYRMSSILPLAVPHTPLVDFHIRGYTIPRGTTCLQNIYAVHYDPSLWEEPNLFRPERFLDKDNKPFWPPYLMPFSIGSRLCIGQSIVEMEMRLIFGGLLQRFTFSLPDNCPKSIFERNFGIVVRPKPYSLHIKSRN